MTRLSHSTWGIPQVPIDAVVAQCAALGFDGLELTVIPGWTIDTAGLEASERRHIRTVYDHWLEPCGLSGCTPMLVSDADEHAKNMTRLRRCLDLAAALQRPGERQTFSTTSGGNPDDGAGARVQGCRHHPQERVSHGIERWVVSPPVSRGRGRSRSCRSASRQLRGDRLERRDRGGRRSGHTALPCVPCRRSDLRSSLRHRGVPP